MTAPTLGFAQVMDSYHHAWVGLSRNWKTLLPGSLAFYLPEILSLAGLSWLARPLAANIFKAAVMIVLIALALRISSGKAMDEAGSTANYSVQFFVGDLAFWLLLVLLETPAALFLEGRLPSLEFGQKLPTLWNLLRDGSLGTFALFAAASLPAAYAFLRLNFFGFILRQRGGHFLSAWVESWKMTNGIQVQLSQFYSIMVLLLLLGLLLFTVGILFAFPICLLATARIYTLASANRYC